MPCWAAARLSYHPTSSTLAPCSSHQCFSLTRTSQNQDWPEHPIGLRNAEIKVISRMWFVQRKSICKTYPWKYAEALQAPTKSSVMIFGVNACTEHWIGTKCRRIGSQTNPVNLLPLHSCWQELFTTTQAEQISSKLCCNHVTSRGCEHYSRIRLTSLIDKLPSREPLQNCSHLELFSKPPLLQQFWV